MTIFRTFGIVGITWMVVITCSWISTPGFALKCHVCNSLYNQSCESITDDRYLVDCIKINAASGKNHTNCRKEIFSAFSAAFDMHTQRTLRTCGYEKHPKYTCFHSSNIDLKGTTCECTEDGCNKSNNLYITSNLIILMAFCSHLLLTIIT